MALSGAAHAHGSLGHAAAPGWTFDAWVVGPLLVSLLIGRSGAVAPRSPLPGVNRLTASSRLVFPAPFGPCSTTVPDSMARVAAA